MKKVLFAAFLTLIGLTIANAQQNACGVQGNITPVTCPGLANGAVQLQFADPGVSAGYSIQWSNGNTGATLNNAPAGSYSVTVTYAWNNNGCQSVYNFTIPVAPDQTPPTITCLANQLIQANTNCSGLVGSWQAAFVSDNCTPIQNISVVQSPSANTVLMGNNDSKWVTLTAFDVSGNAASCSFMVTLKDMTMPTIDCPPSLTLNSSQNSCGAVFNYDLCTDDNCGLQSVVQTSGLPSGSNFPIGMNNVMWKATDVAGNTAVCNFTVTVTDQVAPKVICPDNQYITAVTGCATVVNYGMPTATDNCSVQSVSLQSGQSSGSIFSNGLTTVVWKVMDVNGNTSTCSFAVAVSCATTPPMACNLQANVIVADVTCNGGSNGTASVNASGCVGYTYLWNTGATTQGLSNLSAGTYTVTVTDATNPNCKVVATTVVNQPSKVTVAVSTSTGTANADATGGMPGYTYLWSNGAITQTIANLATGNYTVTATDSKWCTGTKTVFVQGSNPVAEVCDGFDNNGNGQIDEGFPNFDGDSQSDCVDNDDDNDGFPDTQDCQPFNSAVYPGAPEVCDGQDNNCNGQFDEGIGTIWYQDLDGDNFGNTSVTTMACQKPIGYVALGSDCNDSNGNINPGMSELDNNIDDNCDGVVDEGFPTGGCMNLLITAAPNPVCVGDEVTLQVVALATDQNFVCTWSPAGYITSNIHQAEVKAMPPAGTTTFIVHCQHNNTGCIENAQVTVTTNCMSPTDEPDNMVVIISPNPTVGGVQIQGIELGTKIQLYATNGQLLEEEDYNGEFDLSLRPAGLYFLKVLGKMLKIVKN